MRGVAQAFRAAIWPHHREAIIYENNRMTLGLDDNVLWLHVAMDSGMIVEIHQSIETSLGDPAHMLRIQAAVFLDDLFQGWPRNIAHDQGQAAVVQL